MTTAPEHMQELSDDALLVLFANGDGQAAAVLTDRLAPRVLGFAARILGDRTEAEDVTQEAMLRLWKMAGDWIQGDAKVSTWLFRVAKNLCTDRLRKKRGIGLDEAPEPIDETPSAEAQLIASDRVSALEWGLAQLPERQREAVVLRHIEGLSNPDIAEVLGVSIEAVESLTARGKRALVGHLANRKEELGL